MVMKRVPSSSKALDSPELLVLKVGTSTLLQTNTDGSQRIRLRNVASLVELIAVLKQEGKQVVLVSSGAVGMGLIKLGIPKPTDIRKKQAVAAAGQSRLMRMYEDLFSTVDVQCAQLLINRTDFIDKTLWTNVKHTIQECLALGVVPIINENDSTNTEELRFGDNDNLAALTAVQLQANWLFLFTDVDNLYDSNPRTNPDAKALHVVDEPWSLQVDTKDEGSGFGTGGMTTKLVAARTTSTAGIPCGLINGEHVERVHTFLRYEAGDSVPPAGTFFVAMTGEHSNTGSSIGDKRRWILSLPVSGTLSIDDGAARAVADHKSLLPAGILRVEGSFVRGEAVKFVHRSIEVARALVLLSASELASIYGKQSSEFEAILGYSVCPEACHRSHTVLTVDPEMLKTRDVVGKLGSSPGAVGASYGGASDRRRTSKSSER